MKYGREVSTYHIVAKQCDKLMVIRTRALNLAIHKIYHNAHFSLQKYKI